MVTTISLEDVILDSAKEVFGCMISMPLERAAESAPQTDELAFLATITFTGDLEGCFGICCSQLCVQAVATNMLCLEPGSPLSDSDIIDALGEVANMVMGGVKTRVQHEITNIEISIPSVICGRQLHSRLSETMSKLAIPITVGQQHHAELSLLYRNRNN